MKVIFFGNSKYSKIVLQDLEKAFSISLVVTLPNISTPIKSFALDNQIDVLEAKTLNEDEIVKISEYKPDFLVVADYGLILPERLLDVPKFASLNVHHSLLPKYRGPSPAPTAILNGDKVSGVTIIKMTKEVDAGDILVQEEYILKEDETTDSLLTKLNTLGGQLLLKIIPDYAKGKLKAIAQDHSKATFTERMKKSDGYFKIDSPPSPEKLDRMIRAYYPWPGVWTRWRGKIVKFHPSPFLVQIEGKKAVPLKAFLNGYPDFPIKEL